MNSFEEKYICNLLYSENKEEVIDKIKSITDSEVLHIIAGNYNWDDGFEVPYIIIRNKKCDLGTALMIFYDADGYSVLQNREVLEKSYSKEWADFIIELEEKILNNKFKLHHIKFVPPLTRIQIYKLKKDNPDIPKIFIEESDGDVLEIPSI